jgi:Uma2 family endonuclease
MTTPSPAAPLRMTVADFLNWPGDGRAKRYQLVDGEVRAMALASTMHGAIQATLAMLIGNRLDDRQSPCRVVILPAVVPYLRAGFNLRIPGLGVTCCPDAPGQIVLPDPVLIVEILSSGAPDGTPEASNETDTRQNVWAYATIPSVREILIVHSTQVAAELLRRQPDANWPKEPEDIGAGGVLRLESIDLACPLVKIYARTHLA